MRTPRQSRAAPRRSGPGPAWAGTSGQVRRAALAWLLLALVLVPTVGQLHKVLHFAPYAGQAHAAAALHLREADAPSRIAGTAAGEGGTAALCEEDFAQALRRLLPQHTTADCQLLDQLALGQALHAVALVLPAALPPGAPAAPRHLGRMPRHAAAFHARAPPLR